MAGSKKAKQIKQREKPSEKGIVQIKEPQQFYSQAPAWSFVNIDKEMWAFSQEHIGDSFWTKILPRLTSWETQKWSDILVTANKQNHSLNLKDLNKVAQDRLISMYIEAESLISLRITGTHRLYGYMVGRVFTILWYDDNHGDNEKCVCRSHLKHT